LTLDHQQASLRFYHSINSVINDRILPISLHRDTHVSSNYLIS